MIRASSILASRRSSPQVAEDEEDDTSETSTGRIMFTDIAGYSRLANHDEKGALKLIRKQRRLLKPIVRNTRVNKAGNRRRFVVELRQFAECRGLCARYSGENPWARHLDLRIGVHQGDIVRDGKDILGDGVNIASRIEPYAPIGGARFRKIQQDLINNRNMRCGARRICPRRRGSARWGYP